MLIKFYDKDDILNLHYQNEDRLVTLSSNIDNVIENTSGFDLIDDYDNKTVLEKHSNHTIIYSKTDSSVTFANELIDYYIVYKYNDEGYVVSYEIRRNDELEDNEYLYEVIPELEFTEYSTQLYDENNFYLYKIIDEEIVDVTDDEKTSWLTTKKEKELISALENKISELSITCGQIIIAGTDVTLSNGTKHYSFTSNDQNNIKNLFDIAVSTKADGIPYHADNEECELYPYLDIIQLYVVEQKYILFHNTYFNMLKAMVKTMASIEEVEAVVYGMDLNEEFAEKMNTILAQSEEVFVKAMTAYGIDVESINS